MFGGSRRLRWPPRVHDCTEPRWVGLRLGLIQMLWNKWTALAKREIVFICRQTALAALFSSRLNKKLYALKVRLCFYLRDLSDKIMINGNVCVVRNRENVLRQVLQFYALSKQHKFHFSRLSSFGVEGVLRFIIKSKASYEKNRFGNAHHSTNIIKQATV